ncbi:MAG: DUF2304 domain-containing protein [Chloroflexi bacterium]|nr:DUF2304 domain-containing protein [Chloroflexota bacterium]
MFNALSQTQIIMRLGPIFLFVVVLELVRRRKLREDYSLGWLFTFGVLVSMGLFPQVILSSIAEFMGIIYEPTAMFVIGMGLMMIILLQFSVVITRLSRENKQAAQVIALLNTRIHELEERLDPQEEN